MIVAAAALVLGGAISAKTFGTAAEPGVAADSLQPVSAFDGIHDRRRRSLALFGEVGKVIEHPRCQNCHPRTDSPTQTDAMRVHSPMVTRGPDDHGAVGMRCATCHHDRNFDPAGVPGAPKWSLAPRELAWQGFSLAHICRQIKDPRRNGGKSMDILIHHMGEDPLVGWAWHPGAHRVPAPGTQAQLGALFRAWVESGAECPA